MTIIEMLPDNVVVWQHEAHLSALVVEVTKKHVISELDKRAKKEAADQERRL